MDVIVDDESTPVTRAEFEEDVRVDDDAVRRKLDLDELDGAAEQDGHQKEEAVMQNQTTCVKSPEDILSPVADVKQQILSTDSPMEHNDLGAHNVAANTNLHLHDSSTPILSPDYNDGRNQLEDNTPLSSYSNTTVTPQVTPQVETIKRSASVHSNNSENSIRVLDLAELYGIHTIPSKYELLEKTIMLEHENAEMRNQLIQLEEHNRNYRNQISDMEKTIIKLQNACMSLIQGDEMLVSRPSHPVDTNTIVNHSAGSGTNNIIPADMGAPETENHLSSLKVSPRVQIDDNSNQNHHSYNNYGEIIAVEKSSVYSFETNSEISDLSHLSDLGVLDFNGIGEKFDLTVYNSNATNKSHSSTAGMSKSRQQSGVNEKLSTSSKHVRKTLLHPSSASINAQRKMSITSIPSNNTLGTPPRPKNLPHTARLSHADSPTNSVVSLSRYEARKGDDVDTKMAEIINQLGEKYNVHISREKKAHYVFKTEANTKHTLVKIANATIMVKEGSDWIKITTFLDNMVKQK